MRKSNQLRPEEIEVVIQCIQTTGKFGEEVAGEEEVGLRNVVEQKDERFCLAVIPRRNSKRAKSIHRGIQTCVRKASCANLTQ